MRMFTPVPLLACLVACAAPADPAPRTLPQTSAPPASSPASGSLVRAEPLPGRRLKVSITAPDSSVSIGNCNQHIVVTLLRAPADVVAWGGESDACLSPPIIVPARATLSFVVSVAGGGAPLQAGATYRARVLHVVQGIDPASAQVADDQVTSEAFALLP